MPLREYPIRKATRPAFLRPVARRRSEVTLKTRATELKRPCAVPILRDPPLRWRQSESPVTVAPSAPTTPSASEASAAFRMAFLPVAASSPSKTSPAVHDPKGTSVSAGCSGAPNHTPSSTLRAVVPPASTASPTFG
jgi:hypothetical protein